MKILWLHLFYEICFLCKQLSGVEHPSPPANCQFHLVVLTKLCMQVRQYFCFYFLFGFSFVLENMFLLLDILRSELFLMMTYFSYIHVLHVCENNFWKDEFIDLVSVLYCDRLKYIWFILNIWEINPATNCEWLFFELSLYLHLSYFLTILIIWLQWL